jgi:hypothetical protein
MMIDVLVQSILETYHMDHGSACGGFLAVAII